MQIGVMGLGRMGANIARRLMRHGHGCVVYDRDPEPGPVARLVARGDDPLCPPHADGDDRRPAPPGEAGGARLTGPGFEVSGQAALGEDPDALPQAEIGQGGGERRPGAWRA